MRDQGSITHLPRVELGDKLVAACTRTARLTKHSRNFGTRSDEIVELSSLLKLATALDVNLHVNWDTRQPHLWELEFIKNASSVAGNGSLVLGLLNDAADQHQMGIVGFAQNMTDCRLPPHEKLLSWYEKHGFRRGRAEQHGIQIRRPRRTSAGR
ncbi:MAG: hypothetical protein NW223_23580 [Hyphomicrobiaceae bacterium]|nr:hypothetical protein [Hyphomicrobiaceae bacterium]